MKKIWKLEGWLQAYAVMQGIRTEWTVPTKAVFLYNAIPVSAQNGTLLVACNNPFDAGLLDATTAVA